MAFQISPLPLTPFNHLFEATPDELAVQNTVRKSVTQRPGFPCRVSLQDAEIGEEVILTHYEHQSADTPYKASHAVYVRVNAQPVELPENEIPQMLRSRPLSLRAFDKAGMMVAADLAEGEALEAVIEQMFLDEQADYIHLHFAKAGCYAARVDRR